MADALSDQHVAKGDAMQPNETIARARSFATGQRLHRLLLGELVEAGCFRRAPVRSALYGAFIIAVYAAGYAALLAGPAIGPRLLALAGLAFITVHAGFLSHELGHGAVTRDRRVAEAAGQLFHTFLTALCYSYFRHIHRSHHPHCNDRSRDPDIQSGVFSMYEQSACEKRGFARFVSRHQAVLIWILVWLQGFTLKIDSLKYLHANPGVARADRWVVAAHFAACGGVSDDSRDGNDGGRIDRLAAAPKLISALHRVLGPGAALSDRDLHAQRATESLPAGPVRDLVHPRRDHRHVTQVQDVLTWGQPFTRGCQQQREPGIGMRGPHVLDPLDLPAPARDDLNRDRP